MALCVGCAEHEGTLSKRSTGETIRYYNKYPQYDSTETNTPINHNAVEFPVFLKGETAVAQCYSTGGTITSLEALGPKPLGPKP